MEDFLYISFCEALAFFVLWPRMMERTNDWGRKQVQRDNPHLRICCNARKWITPVLFIVLTFAAVFLGMDLAIEFTEIVLLNMLVVVTALLLGTIMTQSIVDRFMVGGKHFF